MPLHVLDADRGRGVCTIAERIDGKREHIPLPVADNLDLGCLVQTCGRRLLAIDNDVELVALVGQHDALAVIGRTWLTRIDHEHACQSR